MRRGSNHEKGSMVVEASFIMPIVIVCIFVLIYMGLLLYQKAYIQAIADKTSERGAVLWNNAAKNMEIGAVKKNNLDKSGLYRDLGFLDSNKNIKLESIKKFAEQRLGRFNILGKTGSNDINIVKVELKDYFLYKKIVVTIRETYKIPIGSLLKIFGGGDRYTIEVKSEAIIDQPAELIRNSDFLIDIERELENENPGLKYLGEKSRGMVDGIKEKINSFTGYGKE